MATTDPQQLMAQIASCLTASADSLAQVAQTLSEASLAVSTASQNLRHLSQLAQNFVETTTASHQAGQDDASHEVDNEKHEYGSRKSNNRNRVRQADSESEESSEDEGDQNARMSGGHLQWPGLSTEGPYANFGSSTASHWYITLQEDFDAIPLICYLASKHPKSICFISNIKSTAPYQHIFPKISDRPIIRPGKKATSIVQAVNRFARSRSNLMLLRGSQAMPSNLPGTEVDAIIHWGLPGSHFVPQIKAPNASHTYLLIPSDERAVVTDIVLANGVREHPDSTQLNEYGPASPLLPFRNRAINVISSMNTKALTRIYETRLRKSESESSALEVAQRANRFAARVLLRGEPEDASRAYEVVGPRLSVRSKFLKKHGLMPAVNQGLLTVSLPK